MASPQIVLAQRHRAQQSLLGDQSTQLTLALWRALVRGPGVGTDEWLSRLTPALRAQYTASLRLSQAFYSLSRRLDNPTAPPPEYDAVELVEEAVIASLVATGLKTLSDALESGKTLEEALDSGSKQAVGAAVRTTLSGGRRAIQETAASDPLALGYYWQTREDGVAPCHWCAMLASRGPVYKADSWPDADPRPHGELKVHAHDNCFCHLAPVWKRGQDLPDLTKTLKADWDRVTKQANGQGKMRAWRRWYDAQQRLGGVDMDVA